jgi:hypothetical protein
LESDTCHDATIATVFSCVVIINENVFSPYIGGTGRNVASVEREGVILPRSRKNTSWQIVASWQVFDLAGFILPRLFFGLVAAGRALGGAHLRFPVRNDRNAVVGVRSTGTFWEVFGAALLAQPWPHGRARRGVLDVYRQPDARRAPWAVVRKNRTTEK